MKYEQGSRR